MEKKAKLRTSSDVYHRVKWESDIDSSNYIIGYMDRFAGIMEIPFSEFKPIDEGGEIPFTKIYYFKDGDKVRWDRNSRVDLIFRSGETGEQEKQEKQQKEKEERDQKKNKRKPQVPEGKAGLQAVIVTHRRYLDTPSLLTGRYGDCHVVDVTSDSEDPRWVKFSPYYPHGQIPVPFSPNCFSECVEGIWQGLKVFENQGVDEVKFKTKAMKGLKRGPGGKRGAIMGHSRGVPEARRQAELLGYLEARKQIYIPCYKWVLENCLQEELKELRALAKEKTLVLLDYDVNQNIFDLSSPLSHASLVKRWLEGDWNFEAPTSEQQQEGGKVEKEKEKGGDEDEKDRKASNTESYDSAAYDQKKTSGGSNAPEAKPLPQRAQQQRGARGGGGAAGQVRPTRQKNNKRGNGNGKGNNKKVNEEEAHDSTVPPPGGAFRKLKSCGVLVFTSFTADKKEFLLMKHAPRYDLPKGHVESGETEIECALRELREETGIAAHQVKIDPDFLYTETYYPKYRRFGGETVEKTICIFLGELTQCEENKDIKTSIKLTEHIGYEWIDWNPPFPHLRKLTVGPLLEAVEKHFTEEHEDEAKEKEEGKENGGEDDEEYDDEEGDDDSEDELVGEGRLNEPLPVTATADGTPSKGKKAAAARAGRKTRRQRNVLMQAGYSLLDKGQAPGTVSLFDNKDINFSSKALTNQAQFILKKNHKASFKVDPKVLKYEGEENSSDEGEEEQDYKPPPRGNLGDYLGLPPSSPPAGRAENDGGAKGEEKGTEWACPTCTFLNPPSLSPICSMCEAPRPK